MAIRASGVLRPLNRDCVLFVLSIALADPLPAFCLAVVLCA